MSPPNEPETPTTPDKVVAPFAKFLTEVDKGRPHATASMKFHELVEAVTATGGKGSMTLTIELKPLAKGNGDQLVASVKVIAKPPLTDVSTSTYYVDRTGNLSRNDPLQPDIEGLKIASPVPTRKIGGSA